MHGYILNCSYIVKPFKIRSRELLQVLLRSGWQRFVADNGISSKSQLIKKKKKKKKKKKNNNNNKKNNNKNSNTPINIVLTAEKEKIHKVKIVVLFIK